MRRAHELHDDLDVTGEIVEGNAAYVLAQASKEAALVVVGHVVNPPP